MSQPAPSTQQGSVNWGTNYGPVNYAFGGNRNQRSTVWTGVRKVFDTNGVARVVQSGKE